VVALGLTALARLDRGRGPRDADSASRGGSSGGGRVTFVTALAIVVHATVVLAVQQVVATPLHYASESLTSPTNVAGLLRLFDEGSWPQRLLGTVDVFGLWWMWLLSVGVAAATGQPARRYICKLLAVYVGIAATVAVVFAVLGSGI
jgi:hypothetical protein